MSNKYLYRVEIKPPNCFKVKVYDDNLKKKDITILYTGLDESNIWLERFHFQTLSDKDLTYLKLTAKLINPEYEIFVYDYSYILQKTFSIEESNCWIKIVTHKESRKRSIELITSNHEILELENYIYEKPCNKD